MNALTTVKILNLYMHFVGSVPVACNRCSFCHIQDCESFVLLHSLSVVYNKVISVCEQMRSYPALCILLSNMVLKMSCFVQ